MLKFLSLELPRYGSFVGTKHKDGLKQPKSVSRTAKGDSFVGFGFSQPKIKYLLLYSMSYLNLIILALIQLLGMSS